MDRSKWEYKKLGEVATFLNGYAFKPENWSKHGLKIIRIQNLTDETAPYNHYEGEIDSKYIVRNGDLLISWSATLGAFLWNNDDALLNQHIFKTIFDKSDIDKFYLKYCVISKLEEMAKKIAYVFKTYVGATPRVTVVPVGTLPRSEKKTKRVTDYRNQEE